MTLEQQVTNFELSKRFKELGVKQESVWYWSPDVLNRDLPDETKYEAGWIKEGDVWMTVQTDFSYEHNFSAFTVAEALEGLPRHIEVGGECYELDIIRASNNMWAVGYECGEHGVFDAWTDSNLANAASYARVWLIEQGHVDVNNL